MSQTYQNIGQALYAFMQAIDITPVAGSTWAQTFNYPPKTISAYPAFVVAPAEDVVEVLDADYDDDTITYWVQIYDTYYDASEAEDRLRKIVDLVRTAIRRERASEAPLGNTAYGLRLSGTWGADFDHGERFYRLQVQVRVAQTLV